MRGVADGWTPQDRAIAVALQLYEDGLCPGCGQPRHLSMDQHLERAWEAHGPARCHACTALAEATEADRDVKHQHATSYTVRLRPGVKRPGVKRPN